MSILSLQGLLQNQNLETIPICIVVLCFPHDNIASQALVHFVTARVSLFTDHKISGLPIRAKKKHLRTTYEKLSTILQLIPFLLL